MQELLAGPQKSASNTAAVPLSTGASNIVFVFVSSFFLFSAATCLALLAFQIISYFDISKYIVYVYI